MTSDTRMTTSAVDPQISGAMAVFDRLAPLKDALGIKDLTEPELQLFAMVAYQTGLDPFTKQIYAIKRGGKVTHQTGIDGYRTVAESKTGQYAGSDEAEYEACACGEASSPPEHPAVARVVVHRVLANGHVVDQVGIARWHELKPAHTKGQYANDYLDAMWWRMPYNQLAKCAEANGLRKAFPRVLGGVYIEEEMQQAGPPQNDALVTAAALPTARERLAARREAIEATEQVVIENDLTTPEMEAKLFDPSPGQVPMEGYLDLGAEPEPLSKDAIRHLLEAANITQAEAARKAAEIFPDWNPRRDMTDRQRGILWDALR